MFPSIVFSPQLYNEKRAELEEQQLHLNVGLQKIRETVEQVEDLQKSLSVKANELEAKTALANAKLKQMVKDQQEVRQKNYITLPLLCQSSSIDASSRPCLFHTSGPIFEGMIFLTMLT